MIANHTRRLYYLLAAAPMRINGWRYRLLKAPRSGLRVHLGCGQSSYVEGWLNADANIITARPDLWINFLHRLPFRDNSVSVFFSYHVLEHLPEAGLRKLLAEKFRCLEPGGGIRIGVPHAGNAYRMYAAGRLDWFTSDFPSKRNSLGGRCANFLLCDNEHLGLFDFTYMEELLSAAGFVDAKEFVPARQSEFVGDEILKIEWESDFEVPHTLVVEARKPSAPGVPSCRGQNGTREGEQSFPGSAPGR